MELINRLGFVVLNPNSPHVKEQLAAYRELHPDTYMDYFKGLVAQCDCLAFRALPDGSIPAGVAQEIDWAGWLDSKSRPVFELPSNLLRRILTVEWTREYLKESGQR